MARPKLDLDEEQIKRLASIQCTQEEIALIMKCSVDTIHRRYADAIKEGQATGKTSLRRHMWKKVQEGNVTMMIWLSKQYLGMSEKREVDIVGTVEPLVIDKLSAYELDKKSKKKE